MPNTLIIGMGISATAYLQSMPSGDDVTTLGGPELWSRVEKDHKMGQPTPLLTGNLLPGQRGFTDPPKQGTNFMLAKDFAALLEKQLKEKSKAVVPGECVGQITRSGNGYAVPIEVEKGKTIIRDFDKVIIAAGPGPGRPLMAGDNGKLEKVNVGGMKGFVVGGTDFMSPDWKMPGNSKGNRVAVYGGSATASWAVELAILRGFKVKLWFTRPGDKDSPWDPAKRFSEAFPPGERNKGVEEDTKDVRKVLNLVDVRFREADHGTYVMLEFKDESGSKVLQPVDLFIYALGSAHAADAGIRKILEKSIQESLVPYYDKSQAISSKPTLLGVGAANGSLMIVGSAMSSSGGFNLEQLSARLDKEERELIGKLAPYRDISDSLPPAARPTEGIAMVMAAIEALNAFMPATARPGGRSITYSPPQTITAQPTGLGQPAHGSPNPNFGQPQKHEVDFKWDINFNTSNRTQLATFLAQTTDLHPLAANVAVALIVALRGKSRNPLGLTNDQVDFIVKRAAAFIKVQLQYDKDLERKRLEYDQDYGADWYLDLTVENLTENSMYKGDFERVGIQVT